MTIIEQLKPNTPLPIDESYNKLEQIRSFWSNSYRLPVNYLTSTDPMGNEVLLKMDCESTKDYNTRVSLTKPPSYVQQIVNQFNSYLFTQSITRTGVPAELLEDADGYGNDLDYFMAQATLKAQIKGSSFIMPDSTAPEMEMSIAQAQAASVRPIMVSYDISSLLWWEDDEYIIRYDKENARYFNDEVFIDLKLSRNNRRTTFIKELGEPVFHGYYKAPIAFITPHLWEDSQAAKLAEILQSIVNIKSWLMSELGNKTFSHIVLAGDFNTEDIDKINFGRGKATVLQTEGTVTPTISVLGGSDTAQADSLRKSLADEVNEMYRTASLQPPQGTAVAQAESGISKAVEFEKTNAVIRSIGVAAENAENEMWRLFGITARSSYPRRFDNVLNNEGDMNEQTAN